MSRALIQALRPKQWTKNAALAVPLFFSRNLRHLDVTGRCVLAVGLFCLLSGGIYLLNDVFDLEQDRKHPLKRHRPLAAGRIGVPTALAAATGLIGLALVGAFLLSKPFGWLAVTYLGLQVAYSLRLKHLVIIDTFSIAASFFLRVVAGAAAIDVEVSSWLLVCTFFVSLFIALAKRRHELVLLDTEAVEHRRVLKKYDILLLDQMISVVTAATIVCYAVYTLATETVERFGTTNLKYTIPFVLYGIYRYLYLVYRKQQGGTPEAVLLTDGPMILNLLAYGFTVAWIIYR